MEKEAPQYSFSATQEYDRVVWQLFGNYGREWNGKDWTEFVMQDDGNFVLKDKYMKPVWHAGTQGNPGAFLRVQDDGNVVIYSKARKALWATYTNAQRPDKREQN